MTGLFNNQVYKKPPACRKYGRKNKNPHFNKDIIRQLADDILNP